MLTGTNEVIQTWRDEYFLSNPLKQIFNAAQSIFEHKNHPINSA